MPRDFNITLESLSVWRDSSALAANNLGPLNGRSLTNDCTSLGNTGICKQDARLITIAVATDYTVMSAECNAACNAVLARRCPSEIMVLHCSLFSSGMNSINSDNFE